MEIHYKEILQKAISTKYKHIPVLVLAFIAVCVPLTAYAALTYTWSNTATVIEPADLVVTDISDNPLTTLSWGSVIQGSSQTKNVKVKNEGGTTLSINSLTTNLASGTGTVSWNISPGTTISGGSTISAIVTLTVSSTAPTGAVTFTLTVNAT